MTSPVARSRATIDSGRDRPDHEPDGEQHSPLMQPPCMYAKAGAESRTATHVERKSRHEYVIAKPRNIVSSRIATVLAHRPPEEMLGSMSGLRDCARRRAVKESSAAP